MGTGYDADWQALQDYIESGSPNGTVGGPGEGPSSYDDQRMLDAAKGVDTGLANGSAQSDSTSNGFVNSGGLPGNASVTSAEITANGGWGPNFGGSSGNPAFPPDDGTGPKKSPSLPLETTTAPPAPSGNGFNGPLLGDHNGPTPGGAGSGTSLSPADRLVKDAAGNVVGVKSENGYFDQNFQSTRNMLDNYQRGDRVSGTVDALNILANMGNKDAAAVLGAEKRTGSNFASSPLEAQWAQAHNAQIQGELPGMTNKASAANLAGQQVQVNANPLSMAESFPMAQKIMDDMAKIDGISKVSFDRYGNILGTDVKHVSATNPTGEFHIPMNQWADWLPVIEARLAAGNGATPQGGAPGGYGGRGGNGGGRAPSAPPPEQFPGGRTVPNNLGAAPESVQSAYAFQPAIMPGGFSPYDEPTAKPKR